VEIELYKDAKDDLAYWQKSGNKAVQKKNPAATLRISMTRGQQAFQSHRVD